MSKLLLFISLGLWSCVSTKIPSGDVLPKRPLVTKPVEKIEDVPAEVPPSDPLSIEVKGEDVVAMGDFGTATPGQYEIGKAIGDWCVANPCALGITMGDNFYPMGVKSSTDAKFRSHFELPYNLVKFTFYPSLGNHDYMGNYKAQIDYRSAKWKMPHRYYKVETDLATLIAIDTEHFDNAQYQFVKESLGASKKVWKVIYGHRPLYSSGPHGNTTAISQYINPLLALPGRNADLFIGGHDHHMELIERDGRVHIVSGAAGKLRSVKGGKYTKFSTSQMGFTYLDFSKDEMKVSFVGKGAKVMYAKTYPKKEMAPATLFMAPAILSQPPASGVPVMQEAPFE